MQKETIVIDVKTEAGRAELKKLKGEVQGVKEETKEASGEMVSFGGTTDKLTGGAISKFTALKSTLVGTVKQLGLVRLAVIGTGIGLLVLAVASLKAAFTSSEEGQNKFAKIMGVIGAITGNFVDILANLGEKLISVFENPKEALKDFGNLIKENIVNRFEGLLELVPQLGKAVNLLLRGQFSEAGKVAANAMGKVALGVEDVTGKINAAAVAVKNFTKEQISEGAAAAKVADMRAKSDKIERDLIVKRSESESKIALLRLKSRQEDEFGAAERKQALLDAQVLEDELLDKETAFLELRKDAQILENTFSRTNKENLTAEAQAIAAVNNQVASRANTARQLQRELNTIQGQIDAQENTKRQEAEAKQKSDFEKEIANAKVLADLKKAIKDAEANTESEVRAKELEDITIHYQSLIDAALLQNINTEELERSKQEKLKVLQDGFNAKDIAAATVLANELAALELKKVQDKENALNAIIGLVGQETEIGKAAFLAKQIMNIKEVIGEAKKTLTFSSLAASRTTVATAEGVAQTAKVGFPQNIPLLIGYAAQAIGIIGSVKSAISSAKSIASGLGGSGSVASIQAPSTPAATAPSFNIVGQSGTNQLAESIGSQEKKPIKAFVVSGDVTTAQSMERNIISSASI